MTAVTSWLIPRMGALVALFAVGRGIAEFWVVDYSDPASYRHSRGGPSLAGVFAVHSGPGLIVLIATAVWLYRWRAHKRQRAKPIRAEPPADHADA
jgi:hypothetical protein